MNDEFAQVVKSMTEAQTRKLKASLASYTKNMKKDRPKPSKRNKIPRGYVRPESKPEESSLTKMKNAPQLPELGPTTSTESQPREGQFGG